MARRKSLSSPPAREDHFARLPNYVAEIGIPAALHFGAKGRKPLEMGPKLGLSRAFWGLWTSEQIPERAPRPLGLKVVAELYAGDLQAAEDHAIAAGRTLESLVAFYASGPIRPIELLRVARIDSEGLLEVQWNYYYDYDHPPTVKLDPANLQGFLSRFDSTEPELRMRLERAIHWYASSMGEADAVDAFLAAWIGFEALGPALNEHFHPSGNRAGCSTCGKAPGTKRDSKLAGIEHTLHVYAPEMFGVRSFDALVELRADIAHGLGSSPRELEQQSSTLIDDLRLCLALGILRVRDEGTPSFGWHSALPRDYERHPDARAEVRPAHSMEHALRPWLGEWFPVTRTFENERTTLDEEGVHERDLKVRVGVGHRRSLPEPARTYVVFERRGVTQRFDDPRNPSAAPVLWRPFALTAAWSRQVARRQTRSNA